MRGAEMKDNWDSPGLRWRRRMGRQESEKEWAPAFLPVWAVISRDWPPLSLVQIPSVRWWAKGSRQSDLSRVLVHRPWWQWWSRRTRPPRRFIGILGWWVLLCWALVFPLSIVNNYEQWYFCDKMCTLWLWANPFELTFSRAFVFCFFCCFFFLHWIQDMPYLGLWNRAARVLSSVISGCEWEPFLWAPFVLWSSVFQVLLSLRSLADHRFVTTVF